MKVLAILGILAMLGGIAMTPVPQEEPKGENIVLLIEPGDEKLNREEVPTIRLQTEEGTLTVPMEEYLVGVVLTELPAQFSPETMKAQAVAARTYAARTLQMGKHKDFDICADHTCCQAWRSREELETAFGQDFDNYLKKGTDAVTQTAGEVLTYQGELIEALYFSCSGGKSEPAVAVWGNEVPYLQSVESPGEENSTKFYSRVQISFREFQDKLRGKYPDVSFPVIPQDWVGDMTHTAGGGVDTVRLGDVTLTGVEVRSLFGLASGLFDVHVGDGEIVFSVRGYGHRVGMSQYGAEAMASGGADYREILTHYYTGVVIKKLSRTESGQWIVQ